MFLMYKVLAGSYDARKYVVMSPKVILSLPFPGLKYTYGSSARDTASSFRRLTAERRRRRRQRVFMIVSFATETSRRVFEAPLIRLFAKLTRRYGGLLVNASPGY